MRKHKSAGDERASEFSDLRQIPSVIRVCETWKANCAAPFPERNKRQHSCYDPEIGLNALARAVIIRAVFKTEYVRDRRKLGKKAEGNDPSWQIHIHTQSHATQLFSEKALGSDPDGWLHKDDTAVAHLYNLNWRNALCSEGSYEDKKIAGLNSWFGSRYRINLPGGQMNSNLLFETRFFGERAVDNYAKLLLHGIYDPGVNLSLARHPAFSDAEIDEAGRRASVDRIMGELCSGNNKGKPIVTINCGPSPTAGSRFAVSIVNRLEKTGRSACYIPLSRFNTAEQLTDHGFRPIVEAMHRFVSGKKSLTNSSAEWTEPPLAEMIRQIREHLVTVPTVFVFDGFTPITSAFPTLMAFIRDEPLERILRAIQHPDTERWPSLRESNVAAFRANYFVIVGNVSKAWWYALRNAGADLVFTESDQEYLLAQPGFKRLANFPDVLETLVKEPAINDEGTVNAFAFLQRAGIELGHEPPDDFTQVETDETELQKAFGKFWVSLKSPWQQLYLQTLAATESGLRWTTAFQVFETYITLEARKAEESGKELGKDGRLALQGYMTDPESFHGFVERLKETQPGFPLLFEYTDSTEKDRYDIFDYPSEAIAKLNDTDPWLVARRGLKSREWKTIDFCDPIFKKLILKMMEKDPVLPVIHRILAELSLQAYRVRVRHTRLIRRMGRSAARNLAVALVHGVSSIQTPKAVQKGKLILPKHTVGELPDEPETAFHFLYSSIFRDLFCDGDVTNISRRHGNGDLQFDMLLLMNGRNRKVEEEQRAIDNWNADLQFDMLLMMNGPNHEVEEGRRAIDNQKCIKAPLWLEIFSKEDAPARRIECFQYLLALCRSAKRASRVETFELALEEISRLDAKHELDPVSRLTYSKFRVDLMLQSFDEHAEKNGQTKSKDELVDELVHAVVQCVPLAGTDEEARVRRVRSAFVNLRRHICRLVKSRLGNRIPHEPTPETGAQKLALDKEIQNIIAANIDALSLDLPIARLPREAISALTRLAWIETLEGERLQRKSERENSDKLQVKGIVLHTNAIAIYWMIKTLAIELKKKSPLAPPHLVGLATAEGYLRSVVALNELLRKNSGDRHVKFCNRLFKTARGVLDTYAREEGVDKSDHIAIQILECTYSRLVAPPVTSFHPSGNAVHGSILHIDDDRLVPFIRSLQWLRDAELELLSISGQPTLRVMLCQERLLSVREVIIRVSDYYQLKQGHPAERVLDKGDGQGYTALIDWMINDLRQLANLIRFIGEYSPGAHYVRTLWREWLDMFCLTSLERIKNWRACESGKYNDALDALGELLRELRETAGIGR